MSGTLALVPPVLAQVLLTLVLLTLTGRARLAALREGRARLADLALSREGWPDNVRKVSNSFQNQFEMPVLFYVLCGVATAIGATGTAMALLAWGFVASRVAHAAIHVTSNRVRHRFNAFSVGVAILVVMWVAIVIRLVAA